MSETLKPCPFCGGDALRWYNEGEGGKMGVECGGCWANTSWGSIQHVHPKLLALAAWNRRAPDETALAAARAEEREKVERLREALEDAAQFPCSCAAAYYERGLVDPDCLADLVSDDARKALGREPVCRGRAARLARAALAESK